MNMALFYSDSHSECLFSSFDFLGGFWVYANVRKASAWARKGCGLLGLHCMLCGGESQYNDVEDGRHMKEKIWNRIQIEERACGVGLSGSEFPPSVWFYFISTHLSANFIISIFFIAEEYIRRNLSI